MTSQSEDSTNGAGAAAGDAGRSGPEATAQQQPEAAGRGAEAVDEAPVEVEMTPGPEAELAEARRQAAENFDRFVRAKAELDNVIKRQQRELADRSRYEGEALCRDLLPVVDDLERALAHTDAADSNGLGGGVELVLKAMLAVLRRHGVERIEAEGQPFDPAEHEAVSTVETEEVAPNTVFAVHRAGYRLRDRLLRASLVTVAKAPEPPV